MIVPRGAGRSYMRLWRNWQTRKTKDLVFPRHAGSSPVNRTKQKDILCGCLFVFRRIMSEKRSDRAPKKICCIKLLSFCAFARKKAYRSAFALGLSRLVCLFYSVDPFAFTSFDILRVLSRIFAHTSARFPCRCLCLFARMMLFFGQNCDLDLVLCSKFFSATRRSSGEIDFLSWKLAQIGFTQKLSAVTGSCRDHAQAKVADEHQKRAQGV